MQSIGILKKMVHVQPLDFKPINMNLHKAIVLCTTFQLFYTESKQIIISQHAAVIL
jgi:hypothetical protein